MSHARSEYEDFKAVAPDAYDAVMALGQLAAAAGIDKQLLELIKLRASQINGCAFCVQHHVLLGERLGVAADKLNLVVVWREAPLFSSRERAALAWTEGHIAQGGVSDEVLRRPARSFPRRSWPPRHRFDQCLNRFGAATADAAGATKNVGAAALAPINSSASWASCGAWASGARWVPVPARARPRISRSGEISVVG